MATCYRLKDGYLLRGWDKLPYAVILPHARRAEFVSPGMMHVLMKCDGTWDFETAPVTDEDQRRIAELVARGYVEACPPGCPISPEQGYRRYPNRYMQSLHWSITGRCNYRCRHCFMSAPEGALGELSHEAALDVARQIGACGVMRVSLTGGEPLVRPDFLDIAGELTRQGVTIARIFTNGSLLTPGILDSLEGLGQHPTIAMSFDGVGHHDWLRNVEGAEKAVDAAFRLCADRGFRTHATAILHRNNLDTLRSTVRHLADLGCDSLRVGCVDDLGRWKRHGRGLTPTRTEYLEALLRYIPSYYEDGMPLTLVLAGLFAATPDRPNHYSILPCHPSGNDPDQLLLTCARHALQLYPDARPAICSELGCDFVGMAPIASDDPDCETTTLREVLTTGSPYMELMDARLAHLFANNEACANCEYLRVCGGGCRAAAHRASGSILGKDPYACAFFRDGWARRLAETVHAVRPDASSS